MGSLMKHGFASWLLGVLFLSTTLLLCSAEVHYYEFFVRESNFTRLCNTKPMLVVNDSYPGPEIRVRRGDTVYVNVHNQGNYGLTIHWHGVKQPRNPWSDGPENVTQCPIQAGTNFTYEIILSDEIGTLWWHAHSDWTRGSVHGAFIILPAEHETYPFRTPEADQTIILQSWYNREFKELFDESLSTGFPPGQSDAYGINGHLGDTYGCPNDTLFRMEVDYMKTYHLRIINAALNEEKFFSITNHTLTVVAQDASYLQRFRSDYILISPGQTMDVLVTANQNMGQYYMATRPFRDGSAPVNLNITTGVFHYTNSDGGLNASLITLPATNDSNAVNGFLNQLRSSNVSQNPRIDVPKRINRRIYIAVSTNDIPCKTGNCTSGPFQFGASLNNVSFEFPQIDILQAYYYRRSNGVFTTNFPLEPPMFFNFTGDLAGFNNTASVGTKVLMLNYGEMVEIVYQSTMLGGGGSHPLHLHGFSFYRVGTGSGNFNNVTDPRSYNLVDPPLINTVHVPNRGWVALRFSANNPGVWFMHCHFERHSSLGMATAVIVRNGKTTNTSIRPPPRSGMPRCSQN